jgi:hypothetical protein
MKRIIKKIIDKIFYRLFPELKSVQGLDSSLVDLSDGSLRKQVRRLTENRDTYVIMDYLDAHDPQFLKDYDRQRLPEFFEKRLGYSLNLDNPRTFNEKLQWLKIHCRKSEMTVMADKFRVREYLVQKGYEQYLNTMHGVYHTLENLVKDWKNLPDQLVLKVNHWSGGNIIIRDKNSFDVSQLKSFAGLLKKNYYYENNGCAEWPYKNIVPCIIAERYLEDRDGGLPDYKDRAVNHTRCFYDTSWHKQDFTIQYPLYADAVEKPQVLNEMIAIAEKLSSGFPHLRVDFYIINTARLILGELTFFHGSGTELFSPQEWDLKFGELLVLHDPDLALPR